MDSDLEIDKFRIQLKNGLQKAIKKMIERAKALDEEIVVSDKEGKVKYIKARDIKI